MTSASQKDAHTSSLQSKAPRLGGKQHQGDEFEKKIQKLNKTIEELQIQSDSVKNKIDKLPPIAEARQKEINSRLKELRRLQADLKKDRDSLFAESDSIDKSFSAKVDGIKKLQSKVKYKTPADIDQRLRELEENLQSGRLRLVEEKKTIQEIDMLERHRNEISNIDQAKIDDLYERKDTIKSKKEAYAEKNKAYNKEYETLKDELKKLDDSLTSQYNKRRVLYDERSALRSQLDEQYDALRKTRDSRREAIDKRMKQQARSKVLKDAEVRVDKAKTDLELASQPAFEQEIALCDILSVYLRKFLNNDDDKTASPASEIIEAQAPEGMVMVTKKADDDVFFAGATSKKKKGKKPKQNKSDSLKIPLETMNNFLEIGVTVPTKVSDISDTLEKLEERKAKFKGDQAAETEKKKNLAEAKVTDAQAKYDALVKKLDEEQADAAISSTKAAPEALVA